MTMKIQTKTHQRFSNNSIKNPEMNVSLVLKISYFTNLGTAQRRANFLDGNLFV